MLEDPRVNFAISTRAGKAGIDHLGLQAESERGAGRSRLAPRAGGRRGHGAEGRLLLLREERQVLDARSARYRLGVFSHTRVRAAVREGRRRARDASQTGCLLRAASFPIEENNLPAPMGNTFNVLFLCTGNSARSILAEAFLNSFGGGQFRGYSAGSHPARKVNPFALELLEKNRIGTEGLRSKSWDEFAKPGAPELHFVFTVCDNAAGEACPFWPGQPITAHWGVPDPAAMEGSDEQKRKAFLDAFSQLSTRIRLFLNLPFEKLARQALETRVTEIGKTGTEEKAR